MNAYTIISHLMFCKATADKMETATIVLNELKTLKREKKLPYLTIRRAIKMQESIIKDLEK